MPFEKVEGAQFVSLEVGEAIEGRLDAIREGDYGPVYDITRKDGQHVTLGSKTVLANRIRQEHIGKNLRITRQPDEPSTNRKGKFFQQFVIEVEK